MIGRSRSFRSAPVPPLSGRGLLLRKHHPFTLTHCRSTLYDVHRTLKNEPAPLTTRTNEAFVSRDGLANTPRIHRISAGSYTARPYTVSTHIPYRPLLPWRQLVVRLAACDYINNRPHWLQDLECVFFACVGQVLPVPSWRYERVRYPARAMAQELSSPSRCCYKSQPDTIWRSPCFARPLPHTLPNSPMAPRSSFAVTVALAISLLAVMASTSSTTGSGSGVDADAVNLSCIRQEWSYSAGQYLVRVLLVQSIWW